MQEREEQTPRIFAIVDVETTGTRPLYDRIIDIAIIRVEDGIVTKTINTLVQPGVHLSSSIAALSGITEDMLINAPSFSDIALEIEDTLKGAVFVAHNAHFDYGFIKNEFRRIGMQFSQPLLCTVKLSRAIDRSAKNHDLDALMSRYNITCSRRHRAYPDAKVLFDWLNMLTSFLSKEELNAYIDQILFSDTLPPLLHRNVLKNIPDTPGIYFFYGKERELLYVGKSKNMRTRIRSHFSGASSGRSQKLYHETASIETKETNGELSALLLESETIKTHMPLYNRALRKARSIVVAYAIKNETGHYTLRLEQTSASPKLEYIAAIFRTMTQAKASLRTMAKTERLCGKFLGIETSTRGCFGSQLGTCSGVCVGKENVESYNDRFKKVFRNRAIKSWPYTGPIMIEEKGRDQNTGTIFFVDQWCLLKAVTYDHGDVQNFIASSAFDYDTYKILARYVLAKSNRRAITELSRSELDKALRQTDSSYEMVVEYE
jgi:DNA polymerase III subunit epsilon